MDTISEDARRIPVIADVDVCVIGGSCTGVFAAVSAARHGASAAVIELNGFFGGVAAAGLVNIWHSSKDTEFKRDIIGGLTMEVVERLLKRDAVIVRNPDAHSHYVLNTEELKIELDELVMENNVLPFLHTRFVQPIVNDGAVSAVVVEDKTGRRAIRARMFVDASGDGDLISRIPLPFAKLEDLQPPTACARIRGLSHVENGFQKLQDMVFRKEFHDRLPHGFMWSSDVAGAEEDIMIAGTRVPGCDCSDADDLTRAEIESRRQVRTIMDIARENVPELKDISLSVLPACIGVRETRHAVCLHRLTESEILNGVRFEDAVANGSYRVDVHHSDKPGLTFRYLDGRDVYVVPGQPNVEGRWRPEQDEDPVFYQIPYRSLVPKDSKNVLVAGRLIDADRGAYGAVRVMVNCNQTGEAAGTAAVLAMESDMEVSGIDIAGLRSMMRSKGSIIF